MERHLGRQVDPVGELMTSHTRHNYRGNGWLSNVHIRFVSNIELLVMVWRSSTYGTTGKIMRVLLKRLWRSGMVECSRHGTFFHNDKNYYWVLCSITVHTHFNLSVSERRNAL
jgi:hypothetical protein